MSLPAVDAGQHHVKDSEIVGLGQRQVQSVAPVTRQIDDEAGFHQALPQVIAGFLFVFDDQDFHVHSPLPQHIDAILRGHRRLDS
jgi:hypothetical protein